MKRYQMSEATRRLLVEARTILLDPDHRIVSGLNLAQDKLGKACEPTDENAVKFAPMGAVRRARVLLGLPEQSIYDASLILNRIITARISDQGVGLYNDQATHDQIISLFDEAIELCGVME